MDFREFIEKEEAELFDIGIYQMDEFVGSALKFLGGAGGNLLSQVGRGAVNAVGGIAQGAVGTGQTALAGLQAAGGGFEKGKETFGQAASNLKKGGSKAFRGVAQLGGALSGITPVLRGAQAASEPLNISGVYAPASKNRTFTQDLLGLDSWKTPSEKTPPEKPPSEVIPIKSRQETPPKDSEAKAFLRDLETKEKAKVKPKVKSQPEYWRGLVVAYKSAKTSQEREEIRKKMRLANPYLYQQAVEAGLRKSRA